MTDVERIGRRNVRKIAELGKSLDGITEDA